MSPHMNRRRFLAAASAGSIGAIAGCLGGDGDDNTGGGDPSAEVGGTVTVESKSFDPVRLHVEAGQAVEWVNESGVSHELRTNQEFDDAEEWDMNTTLDEEGTYKYTFEESGIYLYHDATLTRRMMCGAVAVGDVAVDDIDTLPCE